ncbi:FG-GAP-like repeat-containing protein [Mucilaginibacter gilvus]|uniref:IPT/TIG domain-containing protein n=1 Tax=Mucilaginibacter gilvus TaxID=2305909 RepID=A0A3S4Y6H4_9SPHI|nr:FG-GAP-like repeat-containing protein [Mucilaginibacter gilvus]RWY48516.1 hypothetical protein EPL05_19370 [Mucilaginibacter gilvus]
MKSKQFALLLALLCCCGVCLGQIPTVTSLSQASGTAGSSLTINGSNFSANAAENVVYIGAVKAAVTSFSTTALIVTVPAGVATDFVSVTNTALKLTGYSAMPFRITFTGRTGIAASDIESSVDFPAGGNPTVTVVGDFNADGKPDIALANSSGNTISIYINATTSVNGISSSSFSRQDFAVSANPTALAVGDINEDGKLDLAIGYGSGSAVSVLLNTTTVSTSLTFSSSFFAVDSNSNALAIADIDGDGKRDLIVTNFATSNFSVLRNTTAPGSTSLSLLSKANFTTDTNPISITIADVDGDRKQDVIIGNYYSKSLSVHRNTAVANTINSTSFATRFSIATTGQPTAIFCTYIDNDTHPDLIISTNSTTATTSTNSIEIRKNMVTAPGPFTQATSFPNAITLAAGSEPSALGVADIDGDGLSDIVAANYNSKTLSVFRNISTGTTISTSTIIAKLDLPTGNAPASLAAADLDMDGRVDLVSANDLDNSISVMHNFNSASVPAVYAVSTASASIGSFINTDITDFEWGQDPPPGYTVATVSSGTVTGSSANAGRFVYFSTMGSSAPYVPVKGNLTFSAKGSGTIEVQLISTWDMAIKYRKTFSLDPVNYQDLSWKLPDLTPQLEYIFAIIFNGGNSSANASGTFKKNICLSLQQAGMSGNFARYRADAASLIGNKEALWYGWSDYLNAARKKYLQHSSFSRMRFTTNATQIAIEYVRDSYDKKVINLYPFSQTFYNKGFNAAGDTVSGWHGINLATKLMPGKTYTITGLYTTSPQYVWYNNLNQPVDGVHNLAHSSTGTGRDTVYEVTPPAGAVTLGLLVQRTVDNANYNSPLNDTYLSNSNCMIQEGAYGSTVANVGLVPSVFVPYSGTTPSRLSGPAVFVNGKLYNYYQVEGSDANKSVQYVTDVLPAGTKTVEVMANGQGTYTANGVMASPLTRRTGNYLRAVYLPQANTAPTAGTTIVPGTAVFIHDSIISGFNISSDGQNNVWMMKIMRDSTYGFTGDVFSEGYAGRILHTDTYGSVETFAQKLASYAVDKYWIQVGVNDYATAVPLYQYYNELNALVERLAVLRPTATIYIQSIGPVGYSGPNSETYADNERLATGPSANDFRDIQRAIATAPGHTYCRYVDFEALFTPDIDKLADGTHPTDLGNELYANGIRDNSDLLGTVLPTLPLAFNDRGTLRQFVQSVQNVSPITAKKGKAPYTFSLTSGPLPSGLTLNANGVISGTATANGTFPLTVQVTDANNTTVSKNFTLVVKPLPSVMVAPVIIPAGKVGTAYSMKLNGAKGYGKYAVAATGTIPPGLTYNSTTKTLSGTPTTSGTSTFTLTATDHWNFTGGTTYNFTVGTTTPPALIDNYAPLAEVSTAGDLLVNGQVHDLYTQRVYAYFDIYITPSGGTEVLQASKQVVIEANELLGTKVNAGHIPVTGNFTVRMHNAGVSPTQSDSKTFTFASNTNISLTGNANTGPIPEQISATASVSSGGDLIINASCQVIHSQNIYLYYDLYTKVGSAAESYFNSKQVTISAGALTGAPINCGPLAITGNFQVRMHGYTPSPPQSDGRQFTFNADTLIPLYK